MPWCERNPYLFLKYQKVLIIFLIWEPRKKACFGSSYNHSSVIEQCYLPGIPKYCSLKVFGCININTSNLKKINYLVLQAFWVWLGWLGFFWGGGTEGICIKSILLVLEYSYDSLLVGCFFRCGARPKERGYTTAAAAAESIIMLCGRPFCNNFLDPRPGRFMLSSLLFPSNISADLRNSAAWLASLNQQVQP